MTVPHTVSLISPYGGTLTHLLTPSENLQERIAFANQLPSIQVSRRVVCDLELLATGGFSPLTQFMGQEDFLSVLATMRLANGTLFPMPITLPVEPSDVLQLDKQIALRDEQNNLLAVMNMEEIYTWNQQEFAQQTTGTLDSRHPLVAESARWGKLNLSGQLEVLDFPLYYDFRDLRLTPRQTREQLALLGRSSVVAFQTRNPLHRAHETMTKLAAEQIDGTLLLHPAVGMTKPGDVDHYTRVRTYKALVENYYDADRVLLSLLPLAMRMGGPREALWHAIIRRNHGASHFIVGRDHASPGSDSSGKPFYDPYGAHALVQSHADEIGITPLFFHEFVYVPDEDRYDQVTHIPKEKATASISGTQVRENYLRKGKLLPTWFTRPEVAAILSEAYPPRYRQGVCLWFTGLSGAGKSTTAQILQWMLLEYGRRVTVLDGDVVRTHLSKGLGFSKEDRDINVRRIGFVAAEVVKHGGFAICAAVSPYRAVRDDVRLLVGEDHFVEIFVDTPLEECERRDEKGMYAKARRGEIKAFTGISDPYEAPLHPEIRLDTLTHSPQACAQQIIYYLMSNGFLEGQ